VTEPRFTPTELRLLAVLSDGQGHTKRELLDCLDEDMPSAKLLAVHLFRVRRKLKTMAQSIVCVRGFANTLLYQHVRLLRPAHLE
jgi:hypothetical protein